MVRRILVAFAMTATLLPGVAVVTAPPAEAAIQWVKCVDASTYSVSCSVGYKVTSNGTQGIGNHLNKDGKKTTITITLTLERRNPDGSYTGIWTESKSCYDTSCELRSQYIDCNPGYYKWHMVTKRSDQLNRRFYRDTSAFYQY